MLSASFFSLTSPAGKPCCTLKKPERARGGALGCYQRITLQGTDWSRRLCSSGFNKSRVACPVACGDCSICADHPLYQYYFKLYSGHGRCEWALQPPSAAHWGPAHLGPAQLGAVDFNSSQHHRKLSEAAAASSMSAALDELRSEIVSVRSKVDRIEMKLDRLASRGAAAAASIDLSSPSQPRRSSRLPGSGMHDRRDHSQRQPPSRQPPQEITADVVVYDATSGGVAMSHIQCTRSLGMLLSQCSHRTSFPPCVLQVGSWPPLLLLATASAWFSSAPHGLRALNMGGGR